MTIAPILIVDDNPINLRLLRTLLVAEDFDVRTAKDAEEALALLDEFRPSIVLMDLQLPGMDGLELTRRLKGDPRTENAFVLAVTAYAMKGDSQRVLASGCDGYVAKPIDTRTLPALLVSYLHQRGGAGAKRDDDSDS